MARKNNWPNVVPPDTDPGDNTKYLSHALVVASLPPIDSTDPEQVEKRIFEYFRLCADNDLKPTSAGFCMSLGISRATLSHWRNGKFRADSHQAIILKGYSVLDALWQDYMMNGKINPVSGIFLGKNLFNYSDQNVIVVTPTMGQVEEVDVKQIEEKYAELPDYDGEEE